MEGVWREEKLSGYVELRHQKNQFTVRHRTRVPSLPRKSPHSRGGERGEKVEERWRRVSVEVELCGNYVERRMEEKLKGCEGEKRNIKV